MLRVISLVIAALLSSGAHAAVVFTASDAGNGSTNSNAAFANWSASVASFQTEDFTGLSVVGSATADTALGNNFTADSINTTFGADNFDIGVIQGDTLRVSRGDAAAQFTWNIVQPSDAFGFFVRDLSGGSVNISFNDGTSQNFNVSGDSLFWGVSGLSADISTVSFTVNEPGNTSDYDNFVFGSTTAGVPAPSVLALAGLGLVFALRRRRIDYRAPLTP